MQLPFVPPSYWLVCRQLESYSECPVKRAVRDFHKLYPRFVAWDGGVNWVTKVLGSTLAILAAMRMGFTIAVYIVAAT